MRQRLEPPPERSPWRRVFPLSHQRAMATMGMVIVVATAGEATMGMVMVVATAGEAMVGVVMDLGGLTVEAMGMVGAVVVGIRVPEYMLAQVMAITPIPTNALPQGTAGIHAPIMTTNIRGYCWPIPRRLSPWL
jgi:hypothetical protein